VTQAASALPGIPPASAGLTAGERPAGAHLGRVPGIEQLSGRAGTAGQLQEAGRRPAARVARALFTLPVMLLARRGLPSAGLVLVTMVGGALAAGSANTINCYLDRDIDALMRRTSRRPLVAGAGPGG
jgi:protoheme IX farnesyltransferase